MEYIYNVMHNAQVKIKTAKTSKKKKAETIRMKYCLQFINHATTLNDP